MDRDAVLEALATLGERLQQRGLSGDLYVVGGAAMALVYDERRATRDVDALFAPKIEIYRAAREVAADLRLPEDRNVRRSAGQVPTSDQTSAKEGRRRRGREDGRLGT